MSQEVQGMLIRLEATTAQLRQEMARADATVAQVSGRIDRQLATVDSAFIRAGQSASVAGNMVRNAMAGVVAGMSLSSLVSQADAYATIASRLRLVTSSAAEFNAAQKAVFSIAQSSYQPLTATAELYQRIATNQKELKLTGEGVAGIVGTISKTMAISGASASSANAALIQLGQAFASGVLRGEELNSVMEQAPALAQAIAAGMGKTVGQLRTLGADGKLTADAVVKALQSQAKAVESLYAKTAVTIGNSVTAIGNSYTQLIGRVDQAGNASARVASVIVDVSKAIDTLTADSAAVERTFARVSSVAETLAAIIGGRLALAAGQMVIGFAASTKAALQQAVGLATSTTATLRQLEADSAAAKQAVLTAQSRQADAKAMLARAAAEVLSAEQKLGADRMRQQSEINNLKTVQTTLAAERVLEEQRLSAQITEQGRAAARNRMAEARLAEVAIIRQIQEAELQLAATTAATSAEIQAAYAARGVAAAGVAETTLAANAAIRASEAATAAATSASKAMLLVGAAGRGLLALLTGPVGLIAMTAAVAYSFFNVGTSADSATSSLIGHNTTVEDSIAQYKALSAEQQRLQKITWAEQQIKAIDAASDALDSYTYKVERGITLGPMAAEFRGMIEDVEAGRKTLDSVTAWIEKNTKLYPAFSKELVVLASEYQKSTKEAADFGKKINGVASATAQATSNTEQLKDAQSKGGQTQAAKDAWDKYIEQLTKTRDLLGANAEAEAAYTAAKMGATPAQAAQAKIIAEQTDTLKKYQDAVKEGNKVQQQSLKLQLVALYTAEDAATKAAAVQSKAYADTAAAAESSSLRQITAIEQAANFAVASATRVAMGASAPQANRSGYSLLTNGAAPLPTPVLPGASPEDRAEAAMNRIVASTDPNKPKKSDGEKLIEKQAKALDEFTKKADIALKSSNAMADAYLKGADNVRALTIQQEIEEELLKTGAGAREKVTQAINAQHDAQDRLDVAKTIADMKVEIQNLEKEAKATLQGTAALEAFNVEKAVKAELAGKNIAVGSEEYKQLLATTKAQLEANKALEAANKANEIVDRLNPQIKMLKDYTDEQKALNAAMALYPENAALYRDALVKLGNEYEVNRSKATLWGQMTEAAIDRIDSVFANAWANIGEGAESLWDNLKKGFKQTLGEIAHMLTTKPLLASFSNWLTGTDNGQGLGAVWSKLLGSAGGTSTGGTSGGLWSGAVGIGKNLMSAWNTITGVGSSVATGYASGGVSGAVSGGVSYYSNMLSGITTTLKSGFTQLASTFTGATAANAAAIVGAEGITTAALSGAITQGAASVGAQFGTGVTAMTTASYAAAEAGVAASAATLGGQISAALSSAAAMWPLAIIMGMYQSGKLYSAGVRPDASAMWDSAGDTALGKVAMLPQTLTAKYFEKMDGMLGKVVGGKMAAILTGSTLFQAVWSKVGSKLFGSGYQTKDSGIALGVANGDFDASGYIKQKKKGGLISGSSKTRFLDTPLADGVSDALGQQYNDTILTALNNFHRLNVTLNETVLDNLNMATQYISTQGRTEEEIQTALDAWYTELGQAAVTAISDATNSGIGNYNFVQLTEFVDNLYSINGMFELLNVNALPVSVWGGKLTEQYVAMAGGMEALQKSSQSYYEAFFSETERADDTLAAVNKQFTALGLALPASRSGFRAMVEGIDSTTDAGRSMFFTLMNLSENAAAAYSILEKRADDAAAAAKTAADTAAEAVQTIIDKLVGAATTSQSAVQRAIAAEQKATTTAYNARVTALNDMSSTATKSVNDLATVSNSLGNALKALRGDSSDAVKMLRSQAQATLQSALATVKAGGSLSSVTGLDDALSTISGNNTDLYASLEDFNRDQGRTANVVAELNALNGKQLTSAEKLVKSLEDQLEQAKTAYDDQMAVFDQQLEFAQAQIDAINGVDNSIMSVTDAVNAMNAAVVAALGVIKPSNATNTGTFIDSVYRDLLGKNADAKGKEYWQGQVGNGSVGLDQLAVAIKNAATEDAIKSAYKAAGISMNDGASYWTDQVASGALTVAQLEQAIANAAKANGSVRAYATGGRVYGPGTGTSDSILARLSNGEYVMNADATRMFGTEFLDQMNAGNMPAFAAGGPVLDITSPGQIYSAPQAGSMESDDRKGSDALERKVDTLIDVVKQIVGPMKIDSDKSRKLFEKFDKEGMPPTRKASASA
ncbi:tape measure domain-containing protein [Pseudomonas asturiensis]|uniref:Tape measure domain-containing protein n=2 Tax=Pseudomonas asturiensis TaxID=1190415 RepID=A0A1M7J0R0_9PSED|nr:tape measure domain-containing protein [Pseudomonas asturiensis]